MSERGSRKPHPNLAVGIALCGLILCGVAFVLSPHDQLLKPLTLILAGCALTSAFLLVELDGRIFWGGSLIPHICAFSLLGPASVALTVLAEEAAVWATDRYRLRILPVNLFSIVAPNMLAAVALEHLASDAAGLAFYAAVAATAVAAVLMNVLLVTSLVALLYGEPLIDSLRANARVVPAIGIPISLGVAAVALYRYDGLSAIAFVVAGLVIFGYVSRRLAAEQEQHERIVDLAAQRGQLVAQVLEAEDRERRALAESLHDDVVQTLLVVRQDLVESTRGDAVDDGVERLDQALAQLRGTIRTTHPSILDRVGLETALVTLGETFAGDQLAVSVDVEEQASGHDRLLFSIARELLTNATKHASATSVAVRVSMSRDEVVLSVTDNGRGFDGIDSRTNLVEGHIGLQVVSERAQGVGGSLQLDPSHIAGARVVVRLPVPPVAVVRPEAGDRQLARVGENE